MKMKIKTYNLIKIIFFVLLFVLTSDVQVFAEQQDPTSKKDFFEMSIEELMNVPVVGSGSLTETTRRLAPSVITTLTKEDIRRSGARSLYELLDIYVPNFQMIFHAGKLRHMGLRGIISNRDDKYLLLVNGRVMNEKTDFGVMSERDLPMLTDIHHIDVVRGPGSALYGPGALAMVINIVTDNAMTFQGTQVTGRLGAIEEFYSGEVKYGKKLNEQSGVFLYAGATQYPGASMDYAPVVPGRQCTIYSETFQADDEMTHWLNPLNESFRGLPKYKLHGQYNRDGLEIWARYTTGGEYMDHLRDSSKVWYLREGEGYRQGTISASYNQEISPDLSVKYMFSYDTMQVETEDRAWRIKSFKENEYYGRIMATWNPHERHSLAFGGEWSHEQFGRKHDRYSDKAIMYQISGVRKYFSAATEMPRWSTDLKSLLGEHQWNINEQFTTFIGARLDYHTFTDSMFSPRGALIYTPTDKDTFKIIGTRSVRINTAAEMKMDHDSIGEKSDFEVLKALELRYERQQTDTLSLAGGFFYHWNDVVGWSNTSNATKLLGDMTSYGFEVEASYRKEATRISLSHGLAKLIDFDLRPSETEIELTAEPMGYGSDLASWNNHVTKLIVQHDLTTQWSLDGSCYVYWGSPGGKDYAEYRYSKKSDYYKLGFDKPFGPSAFLNLGLEHKVKDNLILRIDGYNLLGLIDKDLNKRRVGFNTHYPGEYRVHAPAIGLSLTYKF